MKVIDVIGTTPITNNDVVLNTSSMEYQQLINKAIASARQQNAKKQSRQVAKLPDLDVGSVNTSTNNQSGIHEVIRLSS